MRLNYYSFGRNPPSLRALSRQLQRYTLLTICHCDIKSPAVVKFFSTRSMKLLSQCDYHSGCARLHFPAGHLHSRKACLHYDSTKSGREMRPLLIVRHRRRLHSHKACLHSLQRSVFIQCEALSSCTQSAPSPHSTLKKRAYALFFHNELCGRNGQVCALLISNEGTVCIRSRHHEFTVRWSDCLNYYAGNELISHY